MNTDRFLKIFFSLLILIKVCSAKVHLSRLTNGNYILSRSHAQNTFNWNGWLNALKQESIREHRRNHSVMFNETFAHMHSAEDYKKILGGDNFGIWRFRTYTGEQGIVTKKNIQKHKRKYNLLSKNKACIDCTCGQRYKNKIVGGELANRNEFPFMVLLRYYNQFLCGGSLITDRHVLTAAHCTEGRTAASFTAVFRILIRTEPIEWPIFFRNIDKIYEHVMYNSETVDRDIALLQLRTSISLANINTVCLPNANIVIDNRWGLATGWGTLSAGGITPLQLHKVALQLLGTQKCIETSNYGESITSNMICAGFIAGGKDTCQGDSGGPLMLYNNGLLTQVGITSWGTGCAQAGYPGVYTKLPFFSNFISSVTVGSCKCKP